MLRSPVEQVSDAFVRTPIIFNFITEFVLERGGKRKNSMENRTIWIGWKEFFSKFFL